MALMPCHHPRPSTLRLQPLWRRLSVHSSLYSLGPEQWADLGASPVCRQSSLGVEPRLEEAAFSRGPHACFPPREAFPDCVKDTHVVEGWRPISAGSFTHSYSVCVCLFVCWPSN